MNEDSWRENSWFHLLKGAIDDIDKYIPTGVPFILIDEETWGAGEVFPYRTVFPFLEANGVYNGSPTSDEEAINELERLIKSGAQYVAVAKQCFWWLKAYPAFANFLKAHFKTLLTNERIIIIDLKN